MKEVMNLGDIKKTDPRKMAREQAIVFKRFNKDLPAPHREDGNAGYDLFARLTKTVDKKEVPYDLVIQPGQVALIPLNLATEIPLCGVGLVFQRSSTYRKWGLRLTNSVGVIDSSYRGDSDEWGAEVQNMTKQPVTIRNGDKICQVLFMPILPTVLVEADKLGNDDRGGFGTSFDNAQEVK